MLKNCLMFQNTNISVVFVLSGNKQEPYFPNQPNIEFQNLLSWSMPIFIGQSYHPH